MDMSIRLLSGCVLSSAGNTKVLCCVVVCCVCCVVLCCVVL